ncbi:HepT-like ribonuclease domain-containing protein [Acetomicrobium sp.]|uniref:HepT-like ribonuclease domain-containing protein n=1 Tax=Acetomicrobium sp. TaxID=1872099 RepID=UPI003075DAB9
MPDKDIVLAKVATIQRCFDRIRDVTGLDPKSLEDIDKQDIFVLNLQRAIQACIDLAAHAFKASRDSQLLSLTTKSISFVA